MKPEVDWRGQVGENEGMGKIAEIRKILGGIRPSKRLGQTFMIDPNLLASIVRDAGVTPQDVVLEIGPGIGALTGIIAGTAARVVSVEIDPRFADIAEEQLAGFDNVEIIRSDFLGPSNTVSPRVERRVMPDPSGSALIVVSNLPYSVAGAMIAALTLWKIPVQRIVVTIQKEMAERIAASPGTKAYGKLSVLVQSTTDVEILRTIPAKCFWPRPSVNSAVLRLTPREKNIEHAKKVGELANGVFQHRRKVIRNALIEATNLDLDGEQADRLLRETGIDASVRADSVTVAQFGKMARFLMGEN